MNHRIIISIAALVAAACGPTTEKSDPPVISSGSGDMGTTAPDAGSETMADGGVAGEDATVAEPTCENFAERPVNGVCERVPRWVEAFASVARSPDPDRNGSNVRVCLLEATGETSTTNGWTIEAGECRAVRFSETSNSALEWEAVPTSVGEVVFTTPSGPIVMDPPTADFSCYRAPNDEVNVNPGDTVGLSIAGAGDVPAFETDILVPDLVEFEASTPTSSQPLSVTWQPAGAGSLSYYFQYSSAVDGMLVGIFGTCDFADDGAGEIPLEIMSAIPDAPENAIGTLTVSQRQTEFIGDTMFQVSGSTAFSRR